jgi:hypothetical protein
MLCVIVALMVPAALMTCKSPSPVARQPTGPVPESNFGPDESWLVMNQVQLNLR